VILLEYGNEKIIVLLLVMIFSGCSTQTYDSKLAAELKKDSPLLPSGLLGPVQLETCDKY
jgi:hypothetical protein